MMTLLAKVFGGLAGPYLTTLTVPLLLAGLLVAAHQGIKAHDARLKAEATNVCDKAWESEVRRQERDAASADATAAREILQAERQINEGLKDELDKLNERISKVPAAGPGSDPRCLSDGVLRLLEGGVRRSNRGTPGKQ